MAKVTSQYTDYALQSLIVNALSKDGASCSFFAKNYDEQGTYEGGTGLRKTFKSYNDLIINYHTLLKVLTGEQRANIRESIPVIDFLNRENTSLLYTYDVDDDGKVDTTTIRSASSVEKTALDLILNEDPFIINRALVGQPIAEHFYNSTGNATTPSIQVSPWLGNNYVEYLYKGILEDTLKINNKTLESSVLKISLYSFEATKPEDITADLYDVGTSYIQFTPNEKDLDDDLKSKLSKLGVEYFFKNSEENKFQTVYGYKTGEKDPYQIDEVSFLTYDQTREDNRYQAELNPEDICVVLPKSTLGAIASLLIFKKDSSISSQKDIKSLTWGGYRLLKEDGETLDTPIKGITSLESVNKGEIYHLSAYPEEAYNYSAEDTNVIRSIDNNNIPEAIPSTLQGDVDIICIESYSSGSTDIKNNWKILGKNYKIFYFPISNYTSSSTLEETKVSSNIPEYLRRTGVYETISALTSIDKIYTAEASGLLDGLYEEPYERDNTLVTDNSITPDSLSKVTKWRFIDDVDKAAEKGVSIEVGTRYFKGHLLGRGYFNDEPLKLTESDYKLNIENVCKPGEEGLIRLADNSLYKGKALLTYDILSNAVSTLFNNVKISNFNNFSIRSVDDVVTRADYDGRTYSNAEAKNLLSDEERRTLTLSSGSSYSYTSILNYPSKLTSLNSTTSGKNTADSDQILQYFESILSNITEESNGEYTLFLDLTDSDGPCVSKRTSYQKTYTTIDVPQYKEDKCLGITVGISQDGTKPQENVTTNVSSSSTGGSLGDIYTQLDKNFAVSYEVNLKDITQEDIDKASTGQISLSDINEQVGSAFNFNIKMITPMEVFSTKNHFKTSKFLDVYNGNASFTSDVRLATSERIVPTGTILVYPEYSKYLPRTLFLLSRKDLGLEEESFDKDGKRENRRSMISFVAGENNASPDSVLCYKVANVKTFKPSKITKVKLKTSDNHYEEVSYKEGLYPSYKIVQHSYVTGFETQTVSLKASTVTSSQGNTFNFEDIVNGIYKSGTTSSGSYITYESYGSLGVSSSETEDSASTLKAKARYSNLLASVSENTLIESALSSGSSKEEEIRTNNLTSRETSETKNASTVVSLEKEILAQKNQSIPDYSIAEGTNTEFVSNHKYKKNSNVIVSSVTTSSEENSILMGSSSTPTVTQSGVNRYYTKTNAISYIKNGRFAAPDNLTVTLNVPIFESYYVYEASPSDVYDCYIYVLEPMNLELDNITLYDQQDNKMDLTSISNVEIFPMSYPSSYFAVNTLKDSSNQSIYQLKNKNDVSTLKGRIIVPGLPEFSSKESLLTAYTRGISMKAIANMIFAEDSSSSQAINSLLGSTVSSLLKSWKLSGINDSSSSGINPLLLEDLPSVVSGLVEAKPILTTLAKNNFTVTSGNTSYTITSSDVNALINRIDSDETCNRRTYEVNIDSSRSDTAYLNNITITDGVISSSEEYKTSFIDELKNRLKGIEITSSKSEDSLRPSLRRISDQVTKAFSSTGSLNEELCKTIDGFLGNGTKAFLKLGETNNTSFEERSLNLTASEAILTLGNKLNNVVATIILKMINEVTSKINTSLEEDIKKLLNSYFTNASSIQLPSPLSLEDLEEYIKKPELLLNISSDSISISKEVESLLRKIKDSYQSKYGLSVDVLNWSKLSFTEWVNKYNLLKGDKLASNFFTSTTDYNIYIKICAILRESVQQYLLAQFKTIYSSYSIPTKGTILNYLSGIQSGETHFNATFGVMGKDNDTSTTEETAYKFCLTELLPYYDPEKKSLIASTKFSTLQESTGYKSKTPEVDLDTINTDANYKDIARQDFILYEESSCDVKTSVLRGIADYVKTSLEGTGSDRYYAKYVKGDSKLSGRRNSLYYKRYLALNNRMNTSDGTLSSLIPIYRNKDLLTASNDYARNVQESYADSMSVIPVSKFSELAWMAPTEASGTTIAMPGKFYYKRELEALRNQIGDQCVLTCNKCTVQNSCPFYNPEEIIKLYCTPAETIDLYFKDNELDLLAYTDEKVDSEGNVIEESYPNIREVDSDGNVMSQVGAEEMKNLHSYYNDILSKIENDSNKAEKFTGKDIQQVREELSTHASFDNEVDGRDLGYLLGARYGTVRRNNMMMLANQDSTFSEFGKTKDKPLPTYQYLYDALYIKDEETYFNYSTSSQVYKVAFEKGSPSNKRNYEGEVKLKMPTSLKILSEASPNDQVYLVSDDKQDINGNPIIPVVYLGLVKNLQFSMGIVEDPSKSVQSEYDNNIYASDIARWCANYYKGSCVEDPIEDIGEDTSNPSKYLEEDQDQYWMSSIKKKIVDSDGIESWITLEGRPREDTGYIEPLVDPNNINEAKVACGKPVVANYINFIRKISIRIYNGDYAGQYDEAGNYLDDSVWTIPWVKNIDSKGKKTLADGNTITWDTQRATLQFMKTNLRLVVIKS